MKACTKCGEVKPLAEFGKHKHHKDGLSTHCKECKNQANAEWYAKNKKSANERSSNYYFRNQEKIRAQGREYRQRHLERIRKQQRESPSTWVARYRRRCRQYGIPEVVESFSRGELIDRWGDECVDCGGEWTDVEHVMPVILGGAHTIENCRPICRPCNLARWHKFHKEAYALLAETYRQAA